MARITLDQYITDEMDWILHCEANGVSYAGPNGPAIREADEDKLLRLHRAKDQGHKHLPRDFFTNPKRYRRVPG